MEMQWQGSGRWAPLLSAPRTGLNWEPPAWQHGRSLGRASSALEGSDKELVIGRKTSPFTRNYSSPLEPFHLLSVVTPVGLLSLPSHPTEL